MKEVFFYFSMYLFFTHISPTYCNVTQEISVVQCADSPLNLNLLYMVDPSKYD